MKTLYLVFALSIFGASCFGQDIVITNITGENTFEQYTAIIASATIKNEGIVSTGSFFIRGVLSTDSIADYNDFSLQSDPVSLSPGESKVVELKSFTWQNITPGNYQLIITADIYGYVTETDETNNVSVTGGYTITTADVDLVFESSTLDMTTISQFDAMQVHFTIQNTGSTPIYKSVTVSFYLSSDPIYTDDDSYLTAGTFDPDSNQVSSDLSLTIPGFYAGENYIIGRVDYIYNIPGDYIETNEFNNDIIVPLTITDSDIDLEIVDATGTINDYSNLICDITIRNNGTTTVFICESDFSFQLQGESGDVPYVHAWGILRKKMEPGESLTIPNMEFFIGGTYGSFATTLFINQYQYIRETDYSNNSKDLGTITLTPPPVPIISISDASWAGEYENTDTQLLVDATFYNSGDSGWFSRYVQLKITSASGSEVYNDQYLFYESYFSTDSSEYRQITLDLTNPLSVGAYTLEMNLDGNIYTLPLTISPVQYSLTGSVEDEMGTPITKGKLFLYQKTDNGNVQFINQIQIDSINTFVFPIDEHDHTLYFIPDRIAFPEHVPTVFGTTLFLNESSFLSLTQDSTVLFKILKIVPDSTGSGSISGAISSGGSTNGRTGAQLEASNIVILLNAAGNPIAITDSDEEGNFSFGNLLPDQYQLVVAFELDQSIMQEPLPVDITTANAHIDLTISPEGIAVENVMFEQVIEFPEITSKTYGDDPFALECTSNSGLSITYSSSDTEIASIEGNMVTILKAGSFIITATQGGNESYLPGISERELVINKAAQTISFDAITDKNSNDPSFELTASSSSELEVVFETDNTDIISISNNTVSIIGTGSVSITAVQSGNENYEAAESITREFKIDLVLRAEDPLSYTRVYPNPTTDIIKIQSENSITAVSITDFTGKVHFVEIRNNEIDMKHLAPGVYFIKFSEGNELCLLKVIKK